jgi:hypothetical protein
MSMCALCLLWRVCTAANSSHTLHCTLHCNCGLCSLWRVHGVCTLSLHCTCVLSAHCCGACTACTLSLYCILCSLLTAMARARRVVQARADALEEALTATSDLLEEACIHSSHSALPPTPFSGHRSHSALPLPRHSVATAHTVPSLSHAIQCPPSPTPFRQCPRPTQCPPSHATFSAQHCPLTARHCVHCRRASSLRSTTHAITAHTGRASPHATSVHSSHWYVCTVRAMQAREVRAEQAPSRKLGRGIAALPRQTRGVIRSTLYAAGLR